MTQPTRPALLSCIAYMLQAAGLTVQELAAHMGVRLEAAPIVVPPPAEPDLDMITPRIAETLQHCDNADGASIPELMAIMGLSIQAVSGYVGRLQRLGRLVRVKAPGVRAPRCFTDPAAAQRWVDSHQQAQDAALQAVRNVAGRKHAEQLQAQRQRAAERQRKVDEKNAERDRRRREREVAEAKRAEIINARRNVTFHPAKAAALPKLQGDAVIPESVRPQVDTTKRPTARWQTQDLPADPRWPSFSATPLGVNPETRMAWA